MVKTYNNKSVMGVPLAPKYFTCPTCNEICSPMKKEGYTQFNIQYIPSLEISGKGLLHVIIIAWK